MERRGAEYGVWNVEDVECGKTRSLESEEYGKYGVSLFVGSHIMLDMCLQENLDTKVYGKLKTTQSSLKLTNTMQNSYLAKCFISTENKKCFFLFGTIFEPDFTFNKVEVYIYAYDAKLREKAVQSAQPDKPGQRTGALSSRQERRAKTKS